MKLYHLAHRRQQAMLQAGASLQLPTYYLHPFSLWHLPLYQAFEPLN